MADVVPARFMDLREISSDWRLNCSLHGNVTMVIVFNDDIKNRAYCQACFETDLLRGSRKTTFDANGGPEPAAVRTA
jgi:hypothetical protein